MSRLPSVDRVYENVQVGRFLLFKVIHSYYSTTITTSAIVLILLIMVKIMNIYNLVMFLVILLIPLYVVAAVLVFWFFEMYGDIFKYVSNSIDRDKELLSVCETLSDEVKNLQDRISLLENKQ